MATEAFDPTHVHSMKYYDYGSDVPFNFDLIFVNEDTDGYDIHSIVDGWLCDLPEGKWPNWVVRGLANLSKEKLADFEISHNKIRRNVLFVNACHSSRYPTPDLYFIF